MPKVGMEPVRRKALVDAALRVIGDHGSLTVTMSEIARQAGCRPCPCPPLFRQQGTIADRDRPQPPKATARRHGDGAEYRRQRRARGSRARYPRLASSAEPVRPAIRSPPGLPSMPRRSARKRRGGSSSSMLGACAPTCWRALKALCPDDDAERIAEGAAAMIDGLYIRQSN